MTAVNKDELESLIDKCNRLPYETAGLVLISRADIVEILHLMQPYTMKMYDEIKSSTTQLTSLIERVETEVIGEDEPTKRPAPDFLLGDVYGVERNELRAEQRKSLATIKQELIEGSK